MQRVTDAPLPLEEDQRRRMRAYLVQMGIRLVCIFLAIFVPGALRWVFVAGAVILPYTAVIFVNAGRDRRQTSTLIDPRALPSRPADNPAPPDRTGRTAPDADGRTWDDGEDRPTAAPPRSPR